MPGARLIGFVAIIALLAALAMPVLAVEPDEVLEDPKLESRARDISANLRCLVCQNQSIDDSNAPLARDLRVLVRERLEAGDTNEQVVDYVVSRYGEFVLLKPPFGLHTLLLWIGPVLILLAGGAFIWRGIRRQRARRASLALATPALSVEEQARLDALLTDTDERT